LTWALDVRPPYSLDSQFLLLLLLLVLLLLLLCSTCGVCCQLDVVNRGFGGYNSRWGLKLLEQVLLQVAASGQQVALMMIWFGANDAAILGRSA
jgi:hypothetical protein